jgi:hypothetical protein
VLLFEDLEEVHPFGRSDNTSRDFFVLANSAAVWEFAGLTAPSKDDYRYNGVGSGSHRPKFRRSLSVCWSGASRSLRRLRRRAVGDP